MKFLCKAYLPARKTIKEEDREKYPANNLLHVILMYLQGDNSHKNWTQDTDKSELLITKTTASVVESVVYDK